VERSSLGLNYNLLFHPHLIRTPDLPQMTGWGDAFEHAQHRI